MTGNETRSVFLDYFKNRDHTEVRSSSLIPKDDNTLLFVNSGMVQFKNTFLGTEKRDYKRAVSSQKCVRAGGKHNDLTNVGYTARHHTFFEMLGNFSFGDYFKKEAIEFGWELITNVYGLPKDKLWVTVFEKDDEAHGIWKNHIGLSPYRIVRMGEDDNFWSMAETGPCGPCSEIIIDQGSGIGCGKKDCNIGCGCDRYLELWNLVFMQFDRNSQGNLTPLANPSIDTGMGLERISAVLQGVKSNYETDLLLGIIDNISTLCGIEYEHGKLHSDISMRVIADHSRAVNFLISDGVFPSNEGRGYVLRRILRRSVRHAKMLGMNEPFLYRILPSVNKFYGEIYPELIKQTDFISQVVKNEEQRFLDTIDRGLELLEAEVAELGENDTLSGKVAFKLYDTYGFPYDLTEDITKSRGIKINNTEFDFEMRKQQKQSRRSWVESNAYVSVAPSYDPVKFTGYENTERESSIQLIRKNNQCVESISESDISEGDIIELITRSTPFYSESGGQVGDRGVIESDRFKCSVINTIKPLPNFVVHRVRIEKGYVRTEDKVDLKIDKDFRFGVESHHTSTHILHAVLREVLGGHVHQAGSLVTTDKFRFDFSHHSALKIKDIRKVEELMNERVRMDDKIEIRNDVPYDEAIKDGAMAIFEEKYGDKVRVVSIGNYSRELCGGTHLRSAGEAGLIKVVNETASSSGVRRIEAVASESALKLIEHHNEIVKKSESALKASKSCLIKDLKAVVEENQVLNKELRELNARSLCNRVESYLENMISIGNIKLLAQSINGASHSDLRTVWSSLKPKLQRGVVVLASKDSEKVFLLVAVTQNLTKKYNAGNIVKELSKIVGGKGGGKPDLGQGGGSITSKMDEALSKSINIIKRDL